MAPRGGHAALRLALSGGNRSELATERQERPRHHAGLRTAALPMEAGDVGDQRVAVLADHVLGHQDRHWPVRSSDHRCRSLRQRYHSDPHASRIKSPDRDRHCSRRRYSTPDAHGFHPSPLSELDIQCSPAAHRVLVLPDRRDMTTVASTPEQATWPRQRTRRNERSGGAVSPALPGQHLGAL